MSINPDLLETLISHSEKNPLNFYLTLNGVTYSIIDVSITHSPIPVNEPTTRGGVYFSDTFAYKMKGVVEDLSIVPLLTKKMLGPSTEFGEIKITTKIEYEKKPLHFEIFTNLTNSVQTTNSIELSMIIVKLNSI